MVTKIRVDFADGTQGEILPPKTRIKSTLFPELTGYIKQWEYNKPGILSTIPYCISWDETYVAYEKLGFLFMYASVDSVEEE